MQKNKLKKMTENVVALLFVAAFILSGVGCGGGDGNDDDFDAFRGRTATIADLEEKIFTFSFVANGEPFHPSLGDRPTTVSFGLFDATNLASFTLEVEGIAASGVAVFEEPNLTLTIAEVDPSLPFFAGQEIILEVLADVDDGRISLTNVETGLEATSEPAQNR